MKMLLAGLILLVTFPALVGSAAATIATAAPPHAGGSALLLGAAGRLPRPLPIWVVHLVGGLQPPRHLERQRGRLARERFCTGIPHPSDTQPRGDCGLPTRLGL